MSGCWQAAARHPRRPAVDQIRRVRCGLVADGGWLNAWPAPRRVGRAARSDGAGAPPVCVAATPPSSTPRDTASLPATRSPTAAPTGRRPEPSPRPRLPPEATCPPASSPRAVDPVALPTPRTTRSQHRPASTPSPPDTRTARRDGPLCCTNAASPLQVACRGGPAPAHHDAGPVLAVCEVYGDLPRSEVSRVELPGRAYVLLPGGIDAAARPQWRFPDGAAGWYPSPNLWWLTIERVGPPRSTSAGRTSPGLSSVSGLCSPTTVSSRTRLQPTTVRTSCDDINPLPPTSHSGGPRDADRMRFVDRTPAAASR